MTSRHYGLIIKDRSDEYSAGHRRAGRACVDWLHRRAEAMDDPWARDVLNAAAFSLGTELSHSRKGCTCHMKGEIQKGCPVHTHWTDLEAHMSDLGSIGGRQEQ
jgi:hypothetical protein